MRRRFNCLPLIFSGQRNHPLQPDTKGRFALKKHSVMKNLLLDILCTGIVLVIFALFHHVLPRAQESIGIVIPRQEQSTVTEMTDAQSAATIQPEASEQTHSTDSALRLASAGDKTATGAGTHASSSGRGSRRKNSTGSSGKKSTSARGVSSDKGGSALTEGAESLPLQAEDPSGGNEPVSLSDKFASHYSATVEQTENSYTSPNLAITVTEETTEDGSITYYLADLYIRDISCFQTVLAEDTYGSGYRDSILNMAALNQALLAINGDYYGNTSEGVVIRNGIIYRANPTDCDVCVLYNDGTMKVMPGSSFSVEDAVANGAWQAWTFGPALLDANGNAISDNTIKMYNDFDLSAYNEDQANANRSNKNATATPTQKRSNTNNTTTGGTSGSGYSSSSSRTTSVRTGDPNNAALPIAAGLIAVIAAAYVLLDAKKRRKG